ncbi:MAG: leucyl aminopeptidase [Actinobacteria bacterium]|nr:leucyl aminopeptidase [Actinomycetota bacterium]
MQVAVEVARPEAAEADVVAVPVVDPPSPLAGQAAELDRRLDGQLSRLVDEGEIRGRLDHVAVVHVNADGLPARRVALAGVGPREAIDADTLRTAAGAVARATRDFGRTVAWMLDDDLALPLPEQTRAVVEGTMLGGYDPGLWKTDGSDRRPSRRLVLWSDGDFDLARPAERARRVADWTNRARDLSNMPPNELTPERLAARASEIGEQFHTLTVEALGPDEMRELGMGSLGAVAQGSHNPPRLIVMRYEAPSPARDNLVLGLVGKAVTFDTGGISLKPALYMEDMKGDMSGGGAVVEAMGALADVECPINAIAVVGATENMPGGGAYRPGDILTAMNGKTIEVINTDAEGRLVLADALWYARQQGATHLLDLATLTGAMELALGDLYSGLFANDDEWGEQIVAAGEASGDHVWRFPLHPRYRRYIDSHFADMKNSSILRQGSPVLAAEFLREFTGEGPWAHLDIAGPAFFRYSRGDYLTQRGGTGFGVRLIVELADRLSGR